MLETAVKCGFCGTVCHTPLTHRQNRVQCANCKTEITLFTFPALLKKEKARSAAPKVDEEESCCFYHAEAKAERVCEDCGRFLCGLCDVSFKGKHLCTICIQELTTKKDKAFSGDVFRYDILAFHIALVSCLFYPFAIISAPIVIFLVIYGLSKPNGVVPRSRWRFVVAPILALIMFSVIIGLIIIVMMGV